MSFEALDTADRAIAVIGVGAVMPDAPDAGQFWDNIVSARYSISDVPTERWDPAEYYDPDPKAPGKTYSKIGGWVRGFTFDGMRHRIPPRVSAAMDEAQMWGIAAAREALSDAGHPDRPLNLDRTATVIGNAMGGELHYRTSLGVMAPPTVRRVLSDVKALAGIDPANRRAIEDELVRKLGDDAPVITEDSMPGELANVVAGRIANVFDLHGPNYICDAACASSLAALDAGIEGLLSRHYDVLVCGGVDRNMGPGTFVKFCKVGALSADGTRPFAKGANGFVMGEGAAIYILKRLADAERDGDRIYAVVRSIGGASDGRGKGITAPNPEGQKRALSRAYERAGFPLSTVTLVEAHGTSTAVGDVAEVESLNAMYEGVTMPKRSVALGSIKSQIGHLKAAAGAAGLLKAILALHHKTLPPSAQFNEPNPGIRFDDGPLFVNTQARPWERPAGFPRRAGVSSFGFGGTNFHVTLEEHIPGMLTSRKTRVQVAAASAAPGGAIVAASARPEPPMLRGLVMVHGKDLADLRAKMVSLADDASKGKVPPRRLPSAESMRTRERIAIDFGDAKELEERARKAIEGIDDDRPAAWRLARGKGVFRGLEAPGKIAFLFPGQGSQYVNMLRELRDASATVRKVFDEADEVMRDRLDGRVLTQLIFVEGADKERLAKAEEALRHTTVTQPAMLAADIALASLLGDYGIHADVVMGHSLGEYAALVAAGVMPFADALIAVSARAREMANVSLADSGKMAGVIGPYEKIPPVLEKLDGYVVAANRNSHKQTVIAGGSAAVDEAAERLRDAGMRVIPLNVSHAFHSAIVAPASEPLRKVISGLHIGAPHTPVVANVDGQLYPKERDAIIDRLARQIAAPVQFVDGLDTLYAQGVRVFVEVGPKKVLASFAEECLSDRGDVVALATNNPKKGPEASFGAALAYLYSIGRGRPHDEPRDESVPSISSAAPATYAPAPPPVGVPAAAPAALPAPAPSAPIDESTTLQLGRMFAEFLDRGMRVYQGGRQDSGVPANPPQGAQGSVVISGAGVGLPGADHRLFLDDGFERILRGEQMIGAVPSEQQDRMVDKNVVRLIKSESESPRLDLIADTSEVLKLAGRRGAFDLSDDFGVPAERAGAFDITTSMAVGAGMEALRDAGIPLVRRYRKTSTGSYLPTRWMLPEPLADETGVVFASAFPGYNRFAELMAEYHTYQAAQARVKALEQALAAMPAGSDTAAIARLIADAKAALEANPYRFERKFLFEILAMGHSQFAEYVGARGPNTQVNAACSSTTLGIAVAEDWIRSGRANRVIVIAADDVTSDTMLEWIGAGFLATGAATTETDVTQAALPFDRRRHGMILGMGACALVVESEDAMRERGMRGIAEVLATDMANSAFHGTRLDVTHICEVMNKMVSAAEQRHGFDRKQIAASTVFISHETYTPARGGSASAEVHALRTTFGDAASDIVIANTKGFTGHPMGVGIEDALAVKILEHRVVPPIPNFREVDPELGSLNLSKGGAYPVEYALRFSAGFGSQLAMTLYRRLAGPNERTADAARYAAWMQGMSGYASPTAEVQQRTLRVSDQGVPTEPLRATTWQYGVAPRLRATAPQTASPPPAAPVFAPQARPTPVPPPMATATPAPSTAAASADGLAQRVLGIVADKTGYPTDMLALDLDLEADLGIDTVKQAEVFAELRSAFDLPRRDDLKLRDYPTLGHVIGYVRDALGLPDTPAEQAVPAAAVPAASAAQPSGAGLDDVAQRVLAIVADKTGYPTDMLALDLDLEADLGIDTVKQAEVFAELRSAFELPRRDDLKLRDYPTLGHVIGYVRAGRPDLAPTTTATQATATQATPAGATPTQATAPQPSGQSDDETMQAVLAIVADKTGYPPDMLALDLDLEADLGIDTVKQAEVFAEVRDKFDIPRVNDLKLRDYPTLGHVVEFVRVNRKAIAPAAPVEREDSSAPQATAPSHARRLVPLPVVRPALPLCKPTGSTIDASKRVVIVGDRGGIATRVAKLVHDRRAKVLHVDNIIDAQTLTKSVLDWAGGEAIDGLFFLPALDAQGSLDEMDASAFRTVVDDNVRALYALARALYASFDREGTFFVTATRLGGTFGYGSRPAQDPCGGPVSGFTKAFARERERAVVKVVDFAPSEAPERMASLLLDEVERDPGAVEVSYADGRRYGVTLAEQRCPSVPAGTPPLLPQGAVVVVTGSGGAITSAIAADLAAATKGTFYLLDLPQAPKADDPELGRVHTDRDALKRDLTTRLRATNERVTPVMVERELQRIEREAATLEGIVAVQRAGGETHYHPCDVTDLDAVSGIVGQVLERHGHIDLIVHAAGLERSRPLESKEPAEFNLVFDVKAFGMFNLLAATRGAKVGAIVSFSSVAGRFGNAGQTDYSAANDFLCKVTSALRSLRPDTRALVIDWTAWASIGMATRGSIPEIMKRAGIEMLDPADGIPVVREEVQSGRRGEIVVAGTLGILTERRDPDGGAKASSPIGPGADHPLALRLVRADPYEGVVMAIELDPHDPFLDDHRIEGVPVLPGVMGIEIFANAARALVPDRVVTAVRDVQFAAPFKCYRDEKREAIVTLRVEETAHGMRARCTLTSIQAIKGADRPAEPKLHFAATLVLSEGAPAPVQRPRPTEKANAGSVSRDDLYRAYFHGEAFKVLERTAVTAEGSALIGMLAQPLPPMTKRDGLVLRTAPRLLELCFQTAGVIEIGSTRKLGLPSRIDEVLIYEGADDTGDRTAEVRLTPSAQGLRFDAWVCDARGQILLEVRGYGTSALPAAMEESVWAPLGAGLSGFGS